MISAYGWSEKAGYAISWTPLGKEYCEAIRVVIGELAVENVDKELWSAVSFLAQIEGSARRGDSASD